MNFKIPSVITFLKGIENQSNIINALIYREILTKKKYSFIGFLGVILEPLIITIIYIIILKIIRVNLEIGMDLFLFFATGLLTYAFFMSVVTRSINSMQANRNLFYYGKIKPIDTILARSFIEMYIIGIVFILILSFVSFLQNKIILDNLPSLFFLFLLLSILSFSFGLIFLVLGHKYQLFKKILPIINRPLFLSSGVLFSILIFKSILLSVNPITGIVICWDGA